MCGIAGFLDPRNERSRQDMHRTAAVMCAVLSHRGPDGEGTWVDADAGIALAHRRLSIVDLSEGGCQPMLSRSGRYVLVTNGEIYNFRCLRRELESVGCKFRSNSDTEVMLEAICAWGLAKAIEKFDGMFAFGLWDRHKRLLHLVRDRFGEKPLYYGWSGGVFLFGSELKALRQHASFDAAVDRDSLALLLRYAYIPAPYSIYHGIRKVMAGSIVTLAAGTPSSPVSEHVYWSCKQTVEEGLAAPFQGTSEEAVAHLSQLLEGSVKLRMQADVPVGAFLSGGYDSSTVVSIMRRANAARIKTFTLGFDQDDETPYARRVARHLGTDHIQAHVTADDALGALSHLPRLYDEPFADSSQIPTFLISKLARDKVSVILTGDGGDELFCGYDRYKSYAALTERDRVTAYQSKISRWSDPTFIVNGAREPEVLMMQSQSWLCTPEFCNQAMYLDTVAYLPDDLLVKLDRAAMGVGLETRSPFLDHRVFEFAWRLPLAMKLNRGERKWILRQVLYRDVPPTLVDRPKQGFSVPLRSWLIGPLRDWAESFLDERRLRQEGFLDPIAVGKQWAVLPADSEPGVEEHAIWAVLMFEAWLEDVRAATRIPESRIEQIALEHVSVDTL